MMNLSNMKKDLLPLYNTVKYYKSSILSKLEQIDDEIRHKINDVSSPEICDYINGKYNVSNEMVIVLENYIKIMHVCDKLLAALKQGLPQTNNDLYIVNHSQPYNNSPAYRVDSVKTPEQSDGSDFEVIESETDTVIVESDVACDNNKELEIVVNELKEVSSPLDGDKTDTEMCTIIADDKLVIIKGPREETAPLDLAKTETKMCAPLGSDNIIMTSTDVAINETALIKQLGRPLFDRRLEAQKKYEDKNPKKEFSWITVSPTKQTTPNSKEQKKRNTKSAFYPILEEDLNVGEQCTFSYIVSPSEFYIHTNRDFLESLEEEINAELNNEHHLVINTCKCKREAKAKFGNFCFFVLPIKRKWLRVEVLDWLDSDADNILVQFIDYGQRFRCKYHNLHPMNEVYAQFPRMATKCHLACIHPPNFSLDWPESTISKFVELSEGDKKSKFTIIFSHNERQSYAVDLLKEGRDVTLSMILVAKRLARQDEIEAVESVGRLLFQEDDDLEDEPENINEAITGYDAKDEARICPFTDGSGRCFKGPSCKFEHGQLSQDGITTDKVLVMSRALVKLELPHAGQYVKVLITGYVSTCRFYAHILQNPSPGCLYNSDFEQFRQTMNSNNFVQTYETFKIHPGLGECVLMKHGDEWHRATCVTLMENDLVEVFMVDHGCKLIKSLKDLRMMKAEYLYMPFQAVQCVLNECYEKRDVKEDLSLNFFTECMLMQVFRGYVVDSDEPLKLCLWDTENMELGMVLKNCGLAADL